MRIGSHVAPDDPIANAAADETARDGRADDLAWLRERVA